METRFLGVFQDSRRTFFCTVGGGVRPTFPPSGAAQEPPADSQRLCRTQRPSSSGPGGPPGERKERKVRPPHPQRFPEHQCRPANLTKTNCTATTAGQSPGHLGGLCCCCKTHPRRLAIQLSLSLGRSAVPPGKIQDSDGIMFHSRYKAVMLPHLHPHALS